ncbi:9160_t:CDS:2, partial [Racocetra persica]
QSLALLLSAQQNVFFHQNSCEVFKSNSMTVAELVKGTAELVEGYETKKTERFIQYAYSSFTVLFGQLRCKSLNVNLKPNINAVK